MTRVRSDVSSTSTSPTPLSSSVCVILLIFPCADASFPAGRLGNPRNRDNLVAGDDERPAIALGARPLRVNEQILHLLASAGEPVARPPDAHLEPRTIALDAPRAEPRGAFEPHSVVLACCADAAAEIGDLRPRGRLEELCERPLEGARKPGRLVREREEVLVGSGMQLPEQRQDLVADQSALRVRVRGVEAERQPVLPAVHLGLLTPDPEQRAD